MRTNYNNASGNSPKTDEMQRNVMRSKATSQFFFISFHCCCSGPCRLCARASRNSLRRTNAKVKLHFRFFRASNYGKINFIFSLSLTAECRKSGNWADGVWLERKKNMVKVRKVSHPMDLVDVKKTVGGDSALKLGQSEWNLFSCLFFFIQSTSVNLIQLLSVVCTSSRIHSSTHSSRVFSHIST